MFFLHPETIITFWFFDLNLWRLECKVGGWGFVKRGGLKSGLKTPSPFWEILIIFPLVHFIRPLQLGTKVFVFILSLKVQHEDHQNTKLSEILKEPLPGKVRLFWLFWDCLNLDMNCHAPLHLLMFLYFIYPMPGFRTRMSRRSTV